MKLLQRFNDQEVHRKPDRPAPVGVAAEKLGTGLRRLVIDPVLPAVRWPLVSCANPLKLPLARTIGSVPLAMAIVVEAAPGSSSLTVLLINSSSGLNAYQPIASAITPAPITKFRLLIKKLPLSLLME